MPNLGAKLVETSTQVISSHAHVHGMTWDSYSNHAVDERTAFCGKQLVFAVYIMQRPAAVSSLSDLTLDSV